MLAIGCDHGGYALKEEVKKHLDERGVEYIDCGCNGESVDYPVIASETCAHITSGECEMGLLFCGTGMGVSLTANKFKGVYAGVVESVYAARMCRQINNCNVLAMGGYIIGETMAKEMVEAFVNTDFHPGFAPARVELLEGQFKIMQDIENENFK